MGQQRPLTHVGVMNEPDLPPPRVRVWREGRLLGAQNDYRQRVDRSRPPLKRSLRAVWTEPIKPDSTSISPPVGSPVKWCGATRDGTNVTSNNRGMQQSGDLVVDGTVVARIELAETFVRRFRGLMLRRELPAGLLLKPERSVHSMWMRQSLEVASIDSGGVVLATEVLRPWRASKHTPGTRQILEAPLGSFARWELQKGSLITITAPALN